MAAVTTLRGTKLYIRIGDGASPETFAHPCLINTKRGIKFTSNTNKVIIPDCENLDDPAWSEVIKDGLMAAIDGAGTLDNKPETIAFYDEFFRSPDSKNVQVWLGTMGHWSGRFKLTNWEITGDRNDNAQASISLESDGELELFAPAA